MSNRRKKEAIACEFRMISGCEDRQTSADVYDVTGFDLPNPAGRAGGACTSALLNILYHDKKALREKLSHKEILLKMRKLLDSEGFDQIPQLSSSRNLDVDVKFDITPDNFNGTKRAILIGINYVGQDGELSGCHNDVLNMKEYLMDVHGFEEDNIMVLMDDGVHDNPTKRRIMYSYRKIVRDSQPGDVVYLHYSGHGGKLKDRGYDEEDGFDETLIPLDYRSAGHIRDDLLFKDLVIPMKRGVFVTSIMDCCHSGTVLDLPYSFKGNGRQTSMEFIPGHEPPLMIGDIVRLKTGGDVGKEGDLAEVVRIVGRMITVELIDYDGEKTKMLAHNIEYIGKKEDMY